jgi:hypothetical protein
LDEVIDVEDDRRPACEQGQRLLHREEQPLHVAVEGLVEVRLGDLPQRDELAAARVGEEDVDPALLLLDDRVEPIEVCQDRDIALDPGDPRPERLHRRVELGLAASRDEDVRTLEGEPPRGGEPDPAVAPGDDRDLPIQLAHGLAPLGRFSDTVGMPGEGKGFTASLDSPSRDLGWPESVEWLLTLSVLGVGVILVPQDGGAGHSWRRVLEQLDCFSGQPVVDIGDAGDICAAWFRSLRMASGQGRRGQADRGAPPGQERGGEPRGRFP